MSHTLGRLCRLHRPGNAWKAAIRRAMCLHWQWEQWHRDILHVLISNQLCQVALQVVQGEQHVCMPCRKSFRRAAAWAVHAFKCHGRVKRARLVADGTQCRACLKHYSSSVALANHLTYSSQCFEQLRCLGITLSPQPGLNSRCEIQGRRHMHLPHLQAQGPFPLPHVPDEAPDPDYEQCSNAWTMTWQGSVHLSFIDKLRPLHQITATLVVPFGALPCMFTTWMQAISTEEDTMLDLFAVGQSFLCSLTVDAFAADGTSCDTAPAHLQPARTFEAWDVPDESE